MVATASAATTVPTVTIAELRTYRPMLAETHACWNALMRQRRRQAELGAVPVRLRAESTRDMKYSGNSADSDSSSMPASCAARPAYGAGRGSAP